MRLPVGIVGTAHFVGRNVLKRVSWRSLAVFFVGLGGAAYFLSFVHGHYPIEHWLVWPVLFAWALALLWCLACAVAGHALLLFLLGRSLPLREHFTFATGLGALAFFLATFVVGQLGLLGGGSFVLVPSLLLAAGSRAVLRTGRRLSRHLAAAKRRTPVGGRSFWSAPALAFGVLAFALLYFGTLSPDNLSYDARWYHLGMAEEFAATGEIRHYPEGWVLGAYPLLAILSYTWAFSLPAALSVKLSLASHLEVIVFVVTLAGIPALVRRLVPGARAPWAWVVLFLFPGIFVYDSNLNSGADHFLAFWAVPIWISLVRFWRSWTVREGLLLAAMLSGALCTKYTALLLVVFPILAVAGRSLFELGRVPRSRSLHALVPPLVLLVAGLLLTSPHWLRNLVLYHDPIFPSGRGLFPSSPWLPENSVVHENYFSYPWLRTPRTWEGVQQALKVLVNFSFVPNNFDWFHGKVPVFGSLFTLSLLALPFLRGAQRLWALAAGVHLGIWVWYWTHHFDRFLQAEVPWMAAFVAAVAVRAWRLGLAARLGAVVLAAAQVLWSLDVPFIPSHVMTAGQSPLRLGIDWVETGYRKQYGQRLRALGVFPQIGETLPRESRVLLHEMHVRLGLGAAVVNDAPGSQGGISYPRHEQPRELHAFLRSLGVTHILWETSRSRGGDSLAGDLVFHGFVTTYTERRRAFGNMTLAALPKTLPRRATWGSKVAALTCRDALPRGLYELGDLASSSFDAKAPVPRPRDVSPDIVSRADWAIVDPACPQGLPAEQAHHFRMLVQRGHLYLYLRER